jgi:hypothetical protein
MRDLKAGSIRIGPYRGAVDAAVDTPALRAQLARLPTILKGADVAVLGEGRNRNLRIMLGVDGGREQPVVVKAFGRENGLRDALARRWGSKAQRAWRAAQALRDAGIGTPAPIAWLERWDGRRLVESYFLAACVERGSSFAAELQALFRQEPECGKFMALLLCVAQAIRGMHDAGFVHYDLGNQNILLRRCGAERWGAVCFIDLNRGRTYAAVDLRRRARDLSRIALPSDLLRVFLAMYWGDAEPPPAKLLRWERHYRRRFALHSRSRCWRHPIRTLRRRRMGEPVPKPLHERDLWIWDERSGQALTVLDGRDRHRLYPRGRHGGAVLATARVLVPVWRRYRQLMAGAYQTPVAMQGRVGMAVEPCPDTWPREAALLAKLGAGLPVLVRFCHHQPQTRHAFLAEVVGALSAAGHPVTLALVQDRRAVNEPDAWARFAERVLTATAGWIEAVELGHAINRVKWGVWSMADYRRLLAPFATLAARYPHVAFMGPAVIDFEYTYVADALRNLPPNFRFAALSHHLYVDRRGAPENRQCGFGTLEKAALARALADVSGGCGNRLIVSEVNWPLLGTGVFSPVGAPYVYPGARFNDPSVSEADYADYMLRYLLIVLCSGLVERVFWWRLVARGFGLVDDRDPDAWRERPGYAALRDFLAEVGAARFVGRDGFGPSPKDAGYAYRFVREDGRALRVAYATGEPLQLPGTDVRLTGRPVYVE